MAVGKHWWLGTCAGVIHPSRKSIQGELPGRNTFQQERRARLQKAEKEKRFPRRADSAKRPNMTEDKRKTGLEKRNVPF